MTLRDHRAVAALPWLLAVSGFTALGYQVIWTRLFAVGLGHELPATYAIIAAFFGGLALGAFLLDRRTALSARPGRWYGALEVGIALWALISAALVPRLADAAPALAGPAGSGGRYWLIAFALPLLSLLPATVCMGATLAAAERWCARLSGRVDQLPRLYALNTLGAALGPLLVTAWVVPALGFSRSLLLLAAVNLAAGIAALALAGARAGRPAAPPPGLAPAPAGRQALAARLFATGCLGVGFELVAIRVMSQVFEGTVYSHAAALSVFLLATAAGAALWQRHGRRLREDRRLATLLIGVSLACLAGVAALFSSTTLYRALRGLLGDTPAAVTAAELALAAPILAPPALLMGALFSCLATAARHGRGGIGWALGLNTAGALVAAPLLGVLVLPAAGLKWTAAGIALAYLLLLPRRHGLPRWAALAPLLAALLLPDRLRVVTLREDETLLAYHEGALASVAVTERPGERNLRINNRFQMGGTGGRALRIQRMQAHVPLLRHPGPRRALFLGVASGVTAGAALAHEDLRIDAVELVPEGLLVLPHFSPENAALHRAPRVSLHVADARRFVRAASGRWDVIVGDLFHPARDGAALLYTLEHFRAVRERLAPDGLFCQWLPVYQLDPAMLRTIVRSFLAVYPEAELWFAGFNTAYPVLGLIGAAALPPFSAREFERRLRTREALRQALAQSAVRDAVQFSGHQLAGTERLAAWAGDGPVNSDDHPRTLFEAPRFTYQRGLPAWRSLQRLHSALRSRIPPPGPVHVLNAREQAGVRRFMAARDDYLSAQMTLVDAADRFAAFTEIAARAPEFTLAYAHAASLALARADEDRGAARDWLQRLVRARPDVGAGRRLLRRLGP